MKTKFHKVFLIALALFLIASMLSACAQPSPTTEPQAVTEAPPADTEPSSVAETPPVEGCTNFGDVTLNVMPVGDAYASAFRMFGDDLKDKYGVSFTFDFTTVPEAFAKVQQDFALGTSSYDIIVFQPWNLPDMAPYLEPIQPFADRTGLDFNYDDWLPTVWAYYTTYHDQWVSMPFDIDVVFIMYNKAAFENPDNQAKYMEEYGKELAPPETWEDYAQIATFFNDWDWAGDGRTHYGAAETWTAGWPWYMWHPRFAAYGGQYFDENMNPMINLPAGVEATKNMVASAEGMVPGVNNFAYQDQATSFTNGDVAMVFSWTSMGKVAELSEGSKIQGNVGYAVLPGGMVRDQLIKRASMEGGWSFGVPTYSENKDAALCVVWYLTQRDKHIEVSADPDTAIDSGTYSSFEPDSKQCTAFEAGQQWCEYSKESIETGFPEIFMKGRAEYMDALNYELGQVLTAGKDPQQAMDDAAEKWDEITDRYGRDAQIEDWAIQLDVLKEMGLGYVPWP
jgi:multiple sugar transport system substrate-binding protein